MNRTRRRIIASILLLLVAVEPIVAQPADPESPFHGEMSVQFNVQLASPAISPGPVPMLSATPSVVWRPNSLGAGLALRWISTTRSPQLLIAPQVRTEFWWFTFSGGWLFQILGDLPSTSLGGLITLGIAPDLVPFAWGRIGIDATLDLYLPTGVLADVPSVFGPLFDLWEWTGGLRDFAEYLLSSPVFGIGVTYTFPI